MTGLPPAAAPATVWRKSTRSGQDGGCVEVALNLPATVAVRDSRNPNGFILAVDGTAWAAFIDGVERGEFGLD
jgi:hypothetical protein